MIRELKLLTEDNIGEILKKLRADSGMSLKEIYNRSGVSPSAISRYENNKRTPTMAVLYAVLDALEVDLFIAKRK